MVLFSILIIINKFQSCINGYLASKIRILVTHQVHFLTSADQIIYLNNGEMKFKGVFTELFSAEDLSVDELKHNFKSSASLSRKNSETGPSSHNYQRSTAAAAESIPLLKGNISTDPEGHVFKRCSSLSQKADCFQDKVTLNPIGSDDLIEIGMRNSAASFLLLNQELI